MIRCNIFVIPRLIDGCRWSICDNWIFRFFLLYMFRTFKILLIVRLWETLIEKHNFKLLSSDLISRKISLFCLHLIFGKHIIEFYTFLLEYLRCPCRVWVKIQISSGTLNNWFVLIWSIVFSLYCYPIPNPSSWISVWIGRSWSNSHLNYQCPQVRDEGWFFLKCLHRHISYLWLLNRKFWWQVFVSYIYMYVSFLFFCISLSYNICREIAES